MKAEILKIAGVKSEKEFYKKFPSQEAFMAKYGKEFREMKKAQNGGNWYGTPNFSNKGNLPQGIDYNPDLALTKTSGMPAMDLGKNWGARNPLPQGVDQTMGSYTGGMDGGLQEADNKYAPYIAAATDVIDGVSMIKGQKNKVRQAKQSALLTGVQADAAGTRDVDAYDLLAKQRRGVRPEDMVMTGEEFYPVNGVGTNVLAKSGKNIKKADFGTFMKGGGNDLLDKFGNKITNGGQGPDAGSTIGGGVGKGVGTAFFGPIGGKVGEFAGKLVGGMIDRSDTKIKKYNKETDRNVTRAGINSMNMSNSFMEDGGEISALEENGELSVGPEGRAKVISQNHHLPNNGETVMFNGPSHAKGGINMMYGENPVEVEGNEPAQVLQDPVTGEESLVISGNLAIPKNVLGDKLSHGKKFKTYISLLSKQEDKQNKILDKASKDMNELTPINSFDRLKMKSFEAMTIGANLKLKEIAEKKQNASFLQKAINDSAEEFGLDADALAKGKHKKQDLSKLYAKNGTNIPKAQNGANYAKEHGLEVWKGNVSKGDKYGKKTASSFSLEEWGAIAENLGFEGQGNEEFQRFLMENEDSAPLIKKRHEDLYKKDPFFDAKLGYGWESADLRNLKKRVAPSELDEVVIQPRPKVAPVAQAEEEAPEFEPIEADNDINPYLNAVNSIFPNFIGTDAEPLNARQLAGEMFALSNNQLDPVQAQTYQPELDTPYDISYQDQLNANQSDFRAIQRMSNNPAVTSAAAAQKYQANSNVLGEEFRANQGFKDKVYSGNRATMNDAKLKNLSILDTQYTRQSDAKSNTKAVTQSALSSISDKYSKNALENKQLQVYENMYNYRYGDDMKLRNRNGVASFTAPTVGSVATSSGVGELDEEELMAIKKIRLDKEIKQAKKAPKSRNGSIVSAMKLSNFSD